MNILIVCPFLPPRIGGIERHSFELAASLVRQDHQVVVVTSETRNGIPSPIPGVQLIALESYEVAQRLPIPKINLRNLRLLQAMRRMKFDIVITQSHLFPICTTVTRTVGSRGCKKIWINHGSGFVPASNLVLSPLIQVYEMLQMRIMRKATNELISVSKGAARWIESCTGIESRVVPNGVPSLAAKLGPASRSPGLLRVMYAGRLLPNKGATEALSIFVETINRILVSDETHLHPAELTIVGSGPIFKELLKLSEGHKVPIRVMNGLDHHQLLLLMRENHVFIYPSTYPEGFPTVILEAASLGMAILVADSVAGLEEAIENGVVEQGNRKDLGLRLEQLIKNPEEAIARGMRAHHYFVKEYNWDAITNKIIGD